MKTGRGGAGEDGETGWHHRGVKESRERKGGKERACGATLLNTPDATHAAGLRS